MGSNIATRIGDKVPDSFQGRAFVVRRDACYLRDEDGRQLVILDDATPPAPHGINVVIESDDFRRVVARDSRAQLRNGVLTIRGAMDTQEAFALGNATLYEGRLAQVRPVSQAAVRAALDQVSDVLHMHAQRVCADRSCRAARRRIATNAERLAAAVAARDLARAELLASGLIGFGHGGARGDAALVGFLAARAVLGQSSEGVSAAVEDASGREADPAWGFLEAAVQGHFCEPLRSLAEAVGAGHPVNARRAARRCLTSEEGWGPDLLVGLLNGFADQLGESQRKASEAQPLTQCARG